MNVQVWDQFARDKVIYPISFKSLAMTEYLIA